MTFRFNEGGGPVEGSKACSRCGHAHQEEGSMCATCRNMERELSGAAPGPDWIEMPKLMRDDGQRGDEQPSRLDRLGESDGGQCMICDQRVYPGAGSLVLIQKPKTFQRELRTPIHNTCAALVLANPASVFEAIKEGAV